MKHLIDLFYSADCAARNVFLINILLLNTIPWNGDNPDAPLQIFGDDRAAEAEADDGTFHVAVIAPRVAVPHPDIFIAKHETALLHASRPRPACVEPDRDRMAGPVPCQHQNRKRLQCERPVSIRHDRSWPAHADATSSPEARLSSITCSCFNTSSSECRFLAMPNPPLAASAVAEFQGGRTEQPRPTT